MNRDNDRGISSLVSDLLKDLGKLLRQEIQLTKHEIFEKLGQLGTGGGLLVGGGLVVFAGLFFVLLAAVFALSEYVPSWAASLIVGGIVVLLGAVLLLLARKKLTASNLVPTVAPQSIKRDAQLIKGLASEDRR